MLWAGGGIGKDAVALMKLSYLFTDISNMQVQMLETLVNSSALFGLGPTLRHAEL